MGEPLRECSVWVWHALVSYAMLCCAVQWWHASWEGFKGNVECLKASNHVKLKRAATMPTPRQCAELHNSVCAVLDRTYEL